MNATELIKAVMAEKGYSAAALAKELGCSTPSFITEKLRRKNGMRTDWLVKMLGAMKCEIIVRDTIGQKKKWVLDDAQGD
jgi:hypothetical protein